MTRFSNSIDRRPNRYFSFLFFFYKQIQTIKILTIYFNRNENISYQCCAKRDLTHVNVKILTLKDYTKQYWTRLMPFSGKRVVFRIRRTRTSHWICTAETHFYRIVFGVSNQRFWIIIFLIRAPCFFTWNLFAYPTMRSFHDRPQLENLWDVQLSQRVLWNMNMKSTLLR